MGQVVLHGDRSALALAGAEHTADAACGADLLHLGAFIPVGALDGDPVGLRDQLDQPLRAGLGTDAAAHAALPVDHGHAVLDGDGLLRAGLDAGPQAHAAVVAVGQSQTGPNGARAVGNADIVALVFGDLAGALAADESDFPLDRLGLGPYDGGDPGGHGRAADRATVHRRLAPGDGSSHRVAARKAAGAAVIARQGLADGGLPLVRLDVEFFARKDQTRADDEADPRDDRGGNQNQFHRSLLRTTARRSP